MAVTVHPGRPGSYAISCLPSSSLSQYFSTQSVPGGGNGIASTEISSSSAPPWPKLPCACQYTDENWLITFAETAGPPDTPAQPGAATEPVGSQYVPAVCTQNLTRSWPPVPAPKSTLAVSAVVWFCWTGTAE